MENMFPHNLPSSGATGSRTSGSRATLVQKVLRHFRGCGILPRRVSKSKARLESRTSKKRIHCFLNRPGNPCRGRPDVHGGKMVENWQKTQFFP
jgi:hypothetical protein